MNVFQRKFVSEVRRCDELERKLRYIQAEVHKDHVHVPVPESSIFPFAPNPREIINLEVKNIYSNVLFNFFDINYTGVTSYLSSSITFFLLTVLKSSF